MKKTILLLLVSLMLPILLTSQNTTQTIKGQILDKDTRQPLIGATVVVSDLESQPGAVSDLDGNFELTGIPTGRHRLEFSYIGYQPFLVEDAVINSAKELAKFDRKGE
jgi:hypothetical protein